MAKVLVIIPAYNEEKNLGQVIKKIKKTQLAVDILVIDDGSTDQTTQEAEKQKAKVISHPFNMGYGAALQTGYKYALEQNYDFVVQLDGDGQHEPASIPPLLEAVQKAHWDVALGSRFLQKDHPYKTQTIRYLGMLLFGKIVSLITKQKITDPTSGFQAFNHKVVKFYTADAYPADFPDADVLLMLYFAGFKIKEIPVTMYPRATGKSMHQGLKPIYYIFKMFLSIFLTLLREKKKFEES